MSEKEKAKKPKKKPNKPVTASLPWAGMGLGAAGLGSAGIAYGLASDKQVASLNEAIANHRPAGYSNPELLPPGHTGFSHYAATLAPAAGLKPFGIPVSDYLVRLRSDPDVLDALGISRDYLLQPETLRSTTGIPHYSSYSKGPVAAYAHQLFGRFKDRTDLNGLAPEGTNYADWMGTKFHDFVSSRMGGNHPLEMDTKLWSNEEQKKVLEDFHHSLSPAEQALRHKMETGNPRFNLEGQANNYLSPAKTLLGVRKALLNTGVTLAGAGAGGIAGHTLYDILMDRNKKKTRMGRALAAGAGAGAGGLLSYFLGTADGRASIAKALRNVKLKALAAATGSVKSSASKERESFAAFLGKRLANPKV